MMKFAIQEALNSGLDIPVGAVIVQDSKIISSACNKKENQNDITAHAEIIAMKNAEKKLGRWRLNDCELYVTLEPCPMCAWAIIQSGIRAVYFGSYDVNSPEYKKLEDLLGYNIFNEDGTVDPEKLKQALEQSGEGLGSKIDLRELVGSKLKVYGGIMEQECDIIIKEYFKKMRINK